MLKHISIRVKSGIHAPLGLRSKKGHFIRDILWLSWWGNAEPSDADISRCWHFTRCWHFINLARLILTIKHWNCLIKWFKRRRSCLFFCSGRSYTLRLIFLGDFLVENTQKLIRKNQSKGIYRDKKINKTFFFKNSRIREF